MYAAMAVERIKNEAVWFGYKFQKKEYSEAQEKIIQKEKAAKEAEKAAKKAEKEAKKAEKKAKEEATPKKKFNIREFLKRKEEDDVDADEFAEDVETGEQVETENLGKEEKNIFRINPDIKTVFEFKTIEPEAKEVSFSDIIRKIRLTREASLFKNTREKISDLIGYHEMMMKVDESERAFDYCIYLMKEDGEEPLLFETDNQDFKEFCNCICFNISKYKPYEDADIGYFSSYDIEDENCTHKYYMTLEDLKENNIIENPEDQCPFEEDKAEEPRSESAFKFKANKDIESPIRILNFAKEQEATEPVAKEETTEKEDFSELDAIFAGLIGKSDHTWERWNGIYALYIARDEDSADQYIIDDGRVMGTATYSILADTETGDTIFVPISMRNICKKVLKSKENKLNIKEVKSISSKFFTCDVIYRFVDFSEVGATIDLFTDEEAKIFENRLKLIVEDMIEKAKGELKIVPRLRFTELKDHNTFTLVSDNKVVSPLVSIGATSSVTVDGLKYVSTKGTIEQFTKGSTKPILTMNVKSSKK